jgi:ribosomal protein L35AE/L33A
LLMEDSFDVSQVPQGIRAAFDHTAAQNFLGASVFWLRRAAALGGEKAALEHWQVTRAGGQRGIVEVISHD